MGVADAILLRHKVLRQPRLFHRRGLEQRTGQSMQTAARLSKGCPRIEALYGYPSHVDPSVAVPGGGGWEVLETTDERPTTLCGFVRHQDVSRHDRIADLGVFVVGRVEPKQMDHVHVPFQGGRRTMEYSGHAAQQRREHVEHATHSHEALPL